MTYEQSIDRICKFASSDENRPQLMYCVYIEDLQALVATDGHKVIFDKTQYVAGRSAFKASTFLKTGDFVSPDFDLKYPHVKQFLPDLDKYTDFITWHVPKFVDKLPTKGHTNIYLTMHNEIMLTRPNHTKLWTCLDLKQLRPLADTSIKFAFKKALGLNNELTFDQLAPVYFVIESGIDGVIMPMRG